jgi:hypothetical protein
MPRRMLTNLLSRRLAGFYEQRIMKGHEGQQDMTTIPVHEKVTSWLTQKSADGTEGQEESSNPILLEGRTHEFLDELDDWIPADTWDGVDKYREFITKTSAYNWLLAKMERGITQAPQEDDLLKRVHEKIWTYFGPIPRLSTRRLPVADSLIFEVIWNPLAFVIEQRYSGDPSVALLSAITLTGSPTNAQALSCLDYLDQTWPLSGKIVASLLRKLMHASNGEKVQGTKLHISLSLLCYLTPSRRPSWRRQYIKRMECFIVYFCECYWK